MNNPEMDWADEKAKEILPETLSDPFELFADARRSIAQALREVRVAAMRDDRPRKQLYEALKLFRSLVNEDEGGVPRYTINPGAALNSVLEETVDPLLRFYK